METPFEVAEAVYYAVVFTVAFLSGVSQTLRSNRILSVWDIVSVGLVSGFLGFAVVSFVDGRIDDRDGDEFFYLGLSALIGLSVNYQDAILRSMWRKLSKQFDFEMPIHETRTKKPASPNDSQGKDPELPKK